MKSDGVIHFIEELHLAPTSSAERSQTKSMTACGRCLNEVGRYSSYVSDWKVVTCKLCLRNKKWRMN